MGVAGIRAAASDHERLLDEALEYFAFAQRFGWTSEQVDNEPAWLIDRYPVILSALDEAKRRR